jgi:hypothetical protein
VRGDTYYVATGTYAARTFDTAVSGTSVITILGATAANHGTETGWSSAYGVDVTQAHWAYQLVINSSYWVFDGAVPTTPLSRSASAYGFLVDKPSPCSTPVNGQIRIGLPGMLSNVTVKHLAVVGCGSAFDVTQKLFIVGGSQSFASKITISTVYIQDGSNNLQFGQVSNSLVEYVYSNRNWTSPANHGTQFNITCSSANTVRNSYWVSGRGTATFDVLELGCNPGMKNWSIYGNVFTDKSDGGNGVISIGDGTTSIANTVLYNNTVVDSTAAFFRQCEAPTGCTGATGNVVKNNLLYNSSGSIIQDTGGAIDHDYTTCLLCTNPPSEPNGETGSYDPFVNRASSNYQVTSGTKAGLTLDAPYNTDLLSKTRGADGVWERGAFEFSGTDTPPGSPLNLRVF